MAGSFFLMLDTTGPEIEVYMPSYATPHVDSEIIVQGNEKLAPWQDFYFIDAAGTRHDFIFAHNGDRFIGIVRFNQFAVGVATLYAQVKDEVNNLSALVTKSLSIIQGGELMVVCADVQTRAVQTDYHYCKLDVSTDYRQVEVRLSCRAVVVSLSSEAILRDC